MRNRTYPNIESDCTTICVEHQWMDLNAESSNVFLLELASHVALHERCLSSATIPYQDALECRNIAFSCHLWLSKKEFKINRLLLLPMKFSEAFEAYDVMRLLGLWILLAKLNKAVN